MVLLIISCNICGAVLGHNEFKIKTTKDTLKLRIEPHTCPEI